jgi:hypothetical protein
VFPNTETSEKLKHFSLGDDDVYIRGISANPFTFFSSSSWIVAITA